MAAKGLTSDSPPDDWTADRLRPGSEIAGYRLEEEIGRGGMAVVFRASDERLGRPVALKVLAPALAADAAFRRRFVRESRAAAVVDDPHIVPIFEAGESGGVLFIAMKLVSGGDVRTLLRRHGVLSAARTAAIVSPVASALDAAHATGLVHRDVKPANMLLDVRAGRPDHVYLSDFGLSKRAQSPGLTSAGVLVGTPHYMAPEQIAGGRMDGRVDQYSLACATFELLSGALPFEGGNAVAVIHAHAFDQPPPLTSLRPVLPSAVDAVLARALAKAPADRYTTCQEFAESLRAALGLPPYADEPVARPGFERAHTLATDRNVAEPDKADQEQSAPAEKKAAKPPTPGRHRRRRRFLILAIATALLLGAIPGATVLLSRPSTAAPMIPVTGALEDVTVESAADIWALGGSCAFSCLAQAPTSPAVISHWNGASWSQFPSPVREARLGGVAASPAGDIWAVGYSCVADCGRGSTVPEVDQTLILHSDGRGFSRIYSPSPGRSARLTSVTVGPSGTAYAAGYYCLSGCGGLTEMDRPLLLSWNHGEWSQLAIASPGRSARLAGVSAGPAGVPWAVGYYCEVCGFFAINRILTLRPGNAVWSSAPSPSRGAGGQLAAVSVTAGGVAWAVGWDSAGVLIMQWDTRRWRIVNIRSPGHIAQLFGVSAAAGGVVWAVGKYCVSGCDGYNQTDHTLIVRLDARGWRIEASPSSGTRGRLIGVSSGPDGTAWAVGYSCVSSCGTASERDRTLVLRSNGTTWTAG